MNSGIGSLLETRTYLLSKGLNEEIVDSLAKRYLAKLEINSKIFSVIDLFTTS